MGEWSVGRTRKRRTDMFSRSSTIFATVTTTYDTSALATPIPNLPALPVGAFSLQFGAPQNTSNDCLVNTNDSAAWDCSMPPGMSKIQMQITMAQDNDSHLIQLFPPPATPGPLRYGMQPPTIALPQRLGEMIDLDDTALGPSYVFQMPYTKVVVLHNDSFSGGAPSKKRAIEQAFELAERDHAEREHAERDQAGYLAGPPPFPPPPAFVRHDMAALPGDTPWVCYWNHTILQGFIYITQPSAAGNASTSVTTSSTTTAPAAATAGSIPAGTSLTPYPKVVKLQERRTMDPAFTVQPYCTQMNVNADGSMTPVTPSGSLDANTVTLAEIPATVPQKIKRRSWDLLTRSHADLERRQDNGRCRCQWLAT